MRMPILKAAASMLSATTAYLEASWRPSAEGANRVSAAARLSECAHDLRQPIQAIELYASAVGRRVDSVEAQQLIGKIHAAVADAQRRLAELTTEYAPSPTPPQAELAEAKVVVIGEDGAGCERSAAALAARGAQVDCLSDHSGVLRRLREPFDLIVEHAGAGDARFGAAFASAIQGQGAAIVVLEAEDAAVLAALKRNGVACLVGLPSVVDLLAAAEGALKVRAISASR